MPFFPFSLLFFSIALAFLAIASFTDLKSRIVSNKLNYSMIALGLALHFLQAVLEGNWQIFCLTIACVIATFAGSFLLWKLGVWAGGDVKLFTALAALVPLNPALIPEVLGYAQGIFKPLELPIFPLTIFIFSIFSMFPLGFAIGIKGILERKKLKLALLKELKVILESSFFFALAIAGFDALLENFSISLLWVFPLLLLLAFLPSKIRAFASVLAFIAGFFITANYSVVLENFLIVLISLFAVSALLKVFFTARKEVLIAVKKISRLEEGDIVAETIVSGKAGVQRFEGLGFSETFKYLKANNLAGLLEKLKPVGRIVADRHSAAGLTVGELKELKKLVRLKKLQDRIKVKLSTAFVPGVLVAFAILAFASDVFWRVFFK